MRTRSPWFVLFMLLGKLAFVLLKGGLLSWWRRPSRASAHRSRMPRRPAPDVQDVHYRELPAGSGSR